MRRPTSWWHCELPVEPLPAPWGGAKYGPFRVGLRLYLRTPLVWLKCIKETCRYLGILHGSGAVVVSTAARR